MQCLSDAEIFEGVRERSGLPRGLPRNDRRRPEHRARASAARGFGGKRRNRARFRQILRQGAAVVENAGRSTTNRAETIYFRKQDGRGRFIDRFAGSRRDF